jgi:hypothetical protein
MNISINSIKQLLAEELQIFPDEIPFTLVTNKSKSKTNTTSKLTSDMETRNQPNSSSTHFIPINQNDNDNKQPAIANPYVFKSSIINISNSRNNTPIKNNMTNAQERASSNTRGRGGGRSPVQTGR